MPLPIPEHTLLRRIGGGSYGEIWLARTALDEIRAVKIIYRDRFEDARPYERELEGIRRFEPVSRKHAGVIDILQVGHEQSAGAFYYIMTAADDRDTGTAIDPQNYRPHTLRAQLQAAAPLPVPECLATARAIAAALSHLHTHDLVHRDIKPSNILYIDTQPRLADIGLVTATDATQSLVGTLGYIPREGPGKPTADLYALCKVLYEMATGKDRADYPEVDNPSPELTQLNNIILKACHEDPAKRYPTAQQLIEDLDACAAHQPLPHAHPPDTPPAPRLAKTLTLTALAALIAWTVIKPNTPRGPVNLTQGLIAHYPLDANASDHSGNAHHGQNHGATPAPGRHGKPGHSLHFSAGHLTLPQSLVTQFAGAQPLSISIWAKIKPEHKNSNRVIIALGEAAYFKAFMIGISGGNLFFSQFLDTAHSSGVNIADNQWHHCAATFDGQTVSLYVDGQLATQKNIQLTINPKTATLGARPDLVPHETWHGTLDNLRLYNRALNAAEVHTLFQQEKP